MKTSRFYYSEQEFETRVSVNLKGEAFPLTSKFKPRPRFTICGSYDSETNTMSFGISRCSSKDQFQRKIGRELAEKRALETPIVKTVVDKENISKVFIYTATQLESLFKNSKGFQLEGKL